MTLLITIGAIFAYACGGALVAGYYEHRAKIEIRAGRSKDTEVDEMTVAWAFLLWPVFALVWGAIFLTAVATATFDNRGAKK